MTPLQNKTAWITGSARGLGKAMAEALLKQGATVYLTDVQEDLLQATQKELSTLGNVMAFKANVTNPQDIDVVLSEIQKKYSLDILINNAGITRDATLLKMTPEQFDQVMDVNLRGVFLCTQACAKIMSQKKYGKIINISSVASRGNFGQTNYAATKAGVVGMTKTWALELSKYNINVNAIAPGIIDSEMTDKIPPQIKEQMVNLIPLKRMGTPQEIADLALFLASDLSSYIQGEVIHINGGYLM